MKKILIALACIVCLLNIFLWPVNKYEWMLHDDPGMILPIDNNVVIYSIFAASPIALLSIFSVFVKSFKNKKMLAVCMILWGIWAYKYGLAIFIK